MPNLDMPTELVFPGIDRALVGEFSPGADTRLEAYLDGLGKLCVEVRKNSTTEGWILMHDAYCDNLLDSLYNVSEDFEGRKGEGPKNYRPPREWRSFDVVGGILRENTDSMLYACRTPRGEELKVGYCLRSSTGFGGRDVIHFFSKSFSEGFRALQTVRFGEGIIRAAADGLKVRKVLG